MSYRRIAKDVLGASWPRMEQNEKGQIRITVRHYTPRHYHVTYAFASLLVLAAIGGWIYVGYLILHVDVKAVPLPESAAGWVAAIALFPLSIAVPPACAEWIMKRHRAALRASTITLTDKTISWRKGWRRRRISLSQCHAITVDVHPEARRGRLRFYVGASVVSIHHGYAGAQTSHVLEFCKDPAQEAARAARAAIACAVSLVSEPQPA